MVDRPIKKSDREAAQAAESAEGKPAERRKVPPPIKKADRKDGGPSEAGSQGEGGKRDERRGGKGRGKGRGRGKDERKAPINPALMRGPKPTKKVEASEEPAAEETNEEATEATTESAEGAETTAESSDSAEATEATAETSETPAE